MVHLHMQHSFQCTCTCTCIYTHSTLFMCVCTFRWRSLPVSIVCYITCAHIHVHVYMYNHCRFIQKQGLDRTFVECDNHMWRVDNRRLPGDITIDGGSDWIAIHRNYSRYLVTGRSNFLTGLKRYYEFSLLPAEVHVHVHAHVFCI